MASSHQQFIGQGEVCKQLVDGVNSTDFKAALDNKQRVATARLAVQAQNDEWDLLAARRQTVRKGNRATDSVYEGRNCSACRCIIVTRGTPDLPFDRTYTVVMRCVKIAIAKNTCFSTQNLACATIQLQLLRWMSHSVVLTARICQPPLQDRPATGRARSS